MFSWLFPERCRRCGVSYKKAEMHCNNGYVVTLAPIGRGRDPHIWPRSGPKWPPYTDEEWAELEKAVDELHRTMTWE
jgi:hypothetical protein